MRFIQFFCTAALVLLFSSAVTACPWCRAEVRSGIYDGDFLKTLFLLLLPLFLIGGIGVGLFYADEISKRLRRLK